MLTSIKKITPEAFAGLDNQVVYSAIILLFVIAVVLIFYRYFITPMRRYYLARQKGLIDRHTQLTAAFADMDPDPVFRFNAEGKILMINEAGKSLKNKGNKIGANLEEVIPELKGINFNECITKGKKHIAVANIKDKHYKFTVTGIPEMNIGQIYGNDITDLKQTEEKLIDALKKAEESEKLKSYFLAQMSHEVRSPLTAILGFNSLLKEELRTEVSDEFGFAFNAIASSGERLKRTMDQLLAMSQLQSGQYNLIKEVINIDEIVDRVYEEFEEKAAEKKLDLLLEKFTSNAVYFADSEGVYQILNNIVDNAIKYTAEGSISIIMNRNKKGKLFIEVADSGIGMSERYTKNLFLPFSQEVMGYNRPFEGNGLGLALSKKYAELNNINIIVESEKDEGSRFTILFEGEHKI